MVYKHKKMFGIKDEYKAGLLAGTLKGKGKKVKVTRYKKKYRVYY